MRLDHLLSMENVVKVTRHFTVFDLKNDRRIPRDFVVWFSGMDATPIPIRIEFVSVRKFREARR